mmetsp:Transcript_1214/g.3700  ORF Transcript_1214/g.3700 Transcript_1214/m.3700 type:complete len:318 (+) Transcript_1214:1403-2356(+)
MPLENIVHTLRHLELAVLPTKLFASRGSFVGTERRTVRVMAVSLVWRTVTDDGLDLDQRRLVGASLRFCDCFPDRIHIRVAVLDRQHLPAICFIALAYILSERKLCVTVDGDAIVVVECNELPQAEMSSVCARFVGNALLHASISHDAVRVVIHKWHSWLVVDSCIVRLSGSEAHSVGNAHAKRAGRHLYAGSLEIFRVPRCFGTPLTELLDVVHRHALIPGEVKQGVLQHATMARRQHEAVAVHPVGILRVEVHLFGKQHIPDRSLSHRCSRMPAVRLVHSVHSEEAHGIDAVNVHISLNCRCARSNASAAPPCNT